MNYLRKVDTQILRDAKALIMQRGWRSGMTHDANVGGFPSFEYPLSAYDAIVEAGGIIAGRAVERMRCAVSPQDPRSLGIIDWNDAHGRNLAQVYEAFDKAIAS